MMSLIHKLNNELRTHGEEINIFEINTGKSMVNFYKYIKKRLERLKKS